MLSCFPDLKEYPEIDTKLKQNHTFVYNSRIIKRSSFSSIFAINDFHIINPTSMGFPLDLIYIKRPRSSYITFFKKYICSSLFRTDYCCCFNWKKIVIPTRNAWCYNRLLKIRINFSMTYSSWDTLNFICFLKYIM